MNAPATTGLPVQDHVDSLREASLLVLVTTSSVALCGGLIPATVRVGALNIDTIADETNPLPIIVPVAMVAVASVLVAYFVSIRLVEHRRPWPFGTRKHVPRQRNWEYFPAVIAFWATSLITRGWWEATRLYLLDDGRFLWVGIPAAVAASFVAPIAALGVAYVVAHLVVGRLWPSPSGATRDAPPSIDGEPTPTPPR